MGLHKHHSFHALFCLVALCTLQLSAHAQKRLDVDSFRSLPQDMTARIDAPLKDQNGDPCAIIKVTSNILGGLQFESPALGITKVIKRTGETWVYVPARSKNISIFHKDYGVFRGYVFPEKIEGQQVYELHVRGINEGETGSTSAQFLTLSIMPSNAQLYIDGEEMPLEDGQFSASMLKGTHEYRIECPDYETTSGEIELGTQIFQRSFRLTPKFGYLNLFTLPVQGFDVFIEGKQVGKSPYRSGHLAPGKYSVRLEKDKYYPVDTTLLIKAGETTEVTCKLTSKEDSLFYNRLMGGKKIAFGLNASYMMPFVSTSCSGAYVGSPVNYALADERENANYKSATGFSLGIHADFRIYKNLFLTAGLNYTQYNYSNSFCQTLTNQTQQTGDNYSVNIGDIKNSFDEKYTYSNLDIPILLSYRFVVSKYSQLMLNFGPVIQCGLSAKMKLTGAEEGTFKTYAIRYGQIDYSQDFGTTSINQHINADMDLYDNSASYTNTNDNGIGIEQKQTYDFKDSPFKRLNMGLQLGIGYEMRGVQFGISYNYMLTNMANSAYWEGDRLPVFSGKTGDNNMPGYSHRIHTLQLKIGYTFRY